MSNKKGSKHLTLYERRKIYEMLENDEPLKEIALTIGKDPRTVSREIQKHRQLNERPEHFQNRNERYKSPCPRCSRYPYVCNGCPNKQYCMYLKRFKYDPDAAEKVYRTILSQARMGFNLTKEEFLHLDQVIYSGVNNGQSLYHIMQNNELPISERTAYRYVEFNVLSVTNLDLRRKVKLRKKRTTKKKRDVVDSQIRINRLYTDYIRFSISNPGVHITQIDVVESCKPIKACLLTVHFTGTRFMKAFWMPDMKHESVNAVFKQLQDLLTPAEYNKLFKIILTDRGPEFSDPLAIEVHHETGEVLSNIFYCDPQASNQKAQIEENHTLLRFIFPKGTSFHHFTQDDIDLALSHINSYHRAVIGTAPIELFRLYFGEELLSKLKVRDIDPDSVYLKPDLFTR